MTARSFVFASRVCLVVLAGLSGSAWVVAACSPLQGAASGSECFTALDCATGLVCVPKGTSHICSKNLSSVETEVDGGFDAGAPPAMGMPLPGSEAGAEASVKDATVPGDSSVPDATKSTPDTSAPPPDVTIPPADTGGGEKDAGGGGEPDTGGGSPKDAGGGGEPDTGGGGPKDAGGGDKDAGGDHDAGAKPDADSGK